MGNTFDAKPKHQPIVQSKPQKPLVQNNSRCLLRKDVHYIIDISQLHFLYQGKCDDRYTGDVFRFSKQFYEKVGHILIPINHMLKKVHQLYPQQIPLLIYNENDLSFTRTSSEHNCFCKLKHHPKDYKGNLSKEPYSISLHFGDRDMSFFEIYYNQHGYINRIHLVCWVKTVLYEFFAEPYQNELQITSAYKKFGVKTNRIFDIPAEIRDKRKIEYQWVCENLPDLAPKSLSAYTRMKNNKTPSFIKLADEAFKLGVSL